jgi:hypothetical protein
MAGSSTQPWGQTIARVRGTNGILVSIASPLAPASVMSKHHPNYDHSREVER